MTFIGTVLGLLASVKLGEKGGKIGDSDKVFFIVSFFLALVIDIGLIRWLWFQ